MMTVATELRQSGVCRGLGLFAKEYVKEGSVIWKFVDGFDVKVHVSKLADLLPVQRSFVETYFWREGEYLYTSCDNSVFQNHSANANSGPQGDDMVALTDIFPGQEILVNYGSFDDDFSTYAHDLKE